MKLITKIGLIGSIASIAAFLGLGVNADSSSVGTASSQAGKDSATSSGSSFHSSCAAYAGPEGANSTCSSDDGKSVTTRASDEGASGSGKNSNSD